MREPRRAAQTIQIATGFSRGNVTTPYYSLIHAGCAGDGLLELILGRSARRGLFPLYYHNVFDYREKNPLQYSILAHYFQVCEQYRLATTAATL